MATRIRLGQHPVDVLQVYVPREITAHCSTDRPQVSHSGPRHCGILDFPVFLGAISLRYHHDVAWRLSLPRRKPGRERFQNSLPEHVAGRAVVAVESLGDDGSVLL